MKKISVLLAVLLICHLVHQGESYASDKFGVIYDIQGKVQLKSAKGKTTLLKREKDILRAVNEGDSIKVMGTGKAVIVSLKEKRGYEIGADSEALIRNMKVAAVKGQIKTLEGLHVPTDDFLETGSKSMGGIALRGVESCIKAVSPVNTAILELTPELKWKNECERSKKVFITILFEGDKVFNTQTESESLRIPDGVLKYGSNYSFVIDGGSVNGLASSIFVIPDEKNVKSIRGKMAYYKGQGNDISHRLSYLFFLLDNNLNEMAKAEIERLKSEFSENEYFK